jgi:hypothetical protein
MCGKTLLKQRTDRSASCCLMFYIFCKIKMQIVIIITLFIILASRKKKSFILTIVSQLSDCKIYFREIP